MEWTAKSSRREPISDVRDACSDLHLRAQCPEDVNVLTRLYRFLADIGPSDVVSEAAMQILRRPIGSAVPADDARCCVADRTVSLVEGPTSICCDRHGVELTL